MSRWRTNRKTGKPFVRGELRVFHMERYTAEQIATAQEKATAAARLAGELHANYYGRYGRENWDQSDYEVADQVYADDFYKLLPGAQYSGKLEELATGPGSSGAELLRAMKRIHLYHGYVAPEETDEELRRRLGLRHVPGVKKHE